MISADQPPVEFHDDPDVLCAVACLHRNGFHREASAFRDHFGGLDFHVPKNPGARTRLVCLIGMDAAQVLADELGGVTVFVAKAETGERVVTRSLIALFSLANLPAWMIAMLLGISERRVFRNRRALRLNGVNLPSKSGPNSTVRKV
jgi:hypothetical protein